MIIEREIEAAYEKFCDSEDRIGTDWEIRSFTAGAKWMQEKIMGEASEGFEDAWLKSTVEDYRGLGNGKTSIASIAVTSKRKAAEMLWQAARLSAEKKIEAQELMLAENEHYIKQLRKDLDWALNYIHEQGEICMISWPTIKAIRQRHNLENV